MLDAQKYRVEIRCRLVWMLVDLLGKRLFVEWLMSRTGLVNRSEGVSRARVRTGAESSLLAPKLADIVVLEVVVESCGCVMYRVVVKLHHHS